MPKKSKASGKTKKTLKVMSFVPKESIDEFGVTKAIETMSFVLGDTIMDELRKSNRRIKNCVDAVSLTATVKTAKTNRK